MLAVMAAETETRRQRLRRELTAEVILSARSQLSEGGRSGVTWRGIARSVGVNPASLYTYFASLDEVFTAVITDSFERLGSAMQCAAKDRGALPPPERLTELALAYRRWAVDHPAEFNLIFTDQLPGYAAPPDGPTVAAQSAIFTPFANALAEIMGSDPAKVVMDPASPASRPDELSALVGLWATMHGLVMLEINNHLPFLDDHETVFVGAMEQALSGWKTL